MIINKGFKFRIYPTKEQENFINQTIGACRFIYNKMLSDKISYYETEKKNLQVTPAKYKEEFSWLKEMDSYALCNEQMNLQKAYNNFFRTPKTGFPKFKSKHRDIASYTTSNVNNVIKILDSKHIKLPKIKSLKIKLHRQLPKDSIIKSVTITRSPSNKFYISILVEYESQVLNKKLDISKSIGLDYSSHDFYVDSFGDKANYPRYFRSSENKLAKEQRKLSKMKLHSNNWYKQKRIVSILQEHIANQRKDFCHKLSCKLTNDFDYIFVEDINLQTLSQCLKLGKSTNDNGFGMFRSFLSYKAFEKGKVFFKINKWDPTSQTCHACGCKAVITKDLSVREWICPDCGSKLNRDINAAINIRNSGLLELNVVNSVLELPFKD